MLQISGFSISNQNRIHGGAEASDRVTGFMDIPWGEGVKNQSYTYPKLNYNYNSPKPKYLIIGYMDPLGKVYRISGLGLGGLGLKESPWQITGHLGSEVTEPSFKETLIRV